MKKQITILHMCVHMHIYSTAHVFVACVNMSALLKHPCTLLKDEIHKYIMLLFSLFNYFSCTKLCIDKNKKQNKT